MLESFSIEARVDFLENHSEYGFVRTDFYYIDASSQQRIDQTRYRNNFNSDILVELMTGETYCTCGCYMVRAQVLLSIYPERRIKPAQVGQNFQMLLPMAYFHKCGYIDEKMYGVVLHSNSHSREFRTPEQELARLAGFEQLLDEIYDLCSIRDNKLLRAKKVRNATVRMNHAISIHKKITAIKQLAVIIINRGVDRPLLKRIACYPFSHTKRMLKDFLFDCRLKAYKTYMMGKKCDRVIYLTFDFQHRPLKNLHLTLDFTDCSQVYLFTELRV